MSRTQVSMIEELPVELFGDESPPTSQSSQHQDLSRPEAPSAMARKRAIVTDVIGVTAIAVVVAIVLRAIGLGGTTPVANVILAIIIYARGSERRRAEYRARMASAWERVDAARRELEIGSPALSRDRRIAYDVAGVGVFSFAALVLLSALGVTRFTAGAWIAPPAIGLALYGWALREYQSAARSWLDRFVRKLDDTSPQENSPNSKTDPV